MQFTWDEIKARKNQKEHGVSFDDATSAFFDPWRGPSQTRIILSASIGFLPWAVRQADDCWSYRIMKTTT